MRSYLWNTGATSPSITVTTPGTYRVDVVDANGIPDQGVYDLQLAFNPRLRIGNPVEYLCNGDEARLEAPTTYKSYLWSTGETTPAIRVTKAGTYALTVVDSNDCTGTSDAVQIIVVDRPNVTITGVNAACRDAEVIYSIPVIPNSTSQWSINGGTILVGANSAAVRVKWTRSGVITVKVSIPRPDGGTCDTTVSLSVNVGNRLRPELLYDRSSLCPGDTIVLRATDGFTSYRWSTGATTPSINVTSGGPYWVEVSDASGCTGGSDTLTVIAYPQPSINILGDKSFCKGAGTTLEAQAAANDVYAWSWNTGATTARLSVTTPGLYTVIGTTMNGCRDTARVLITEGEPILATITDLDFGSVRVGTPANGTLRITNNGTQLIEIAGVTLLDPTLSLPNGFPFTVSSGATVTIDVRWLPTSIGVLNTTARIHLRTAACEDSIVAVIIGEAFDDPTLGTISVVIPDTTTTLATPLSMPVHITLDVPSAGFGSLFVDITFDRRALLLNTVRGAVIVNDRTIDNDRTVTVYIEVMPFRGDTTIWLEVSGLLQASPTAILTPSSAVVGTSIQVLPTYRPGTITFTGCWLPGRLVELRDMNDMIVRRRYDLIGREQDLLAPCQPCLEVIFDRSGRIVGSYLMNNISR
jgi:hypothetical protein